MSTQPPLPSDRLRIGDCVVDVPLREVHAPDARRPRRITPKSMGVLLALVDARGRVVSRDALLAAVWPSTLPTNDVVTQAVTQLRKAFEPARAAGGQPYIETIAKSGYRLLAAVEWLPAAAVEEERSNPSAPVGDAELATGSAAPPASVPSKPVPTPRRPVMSPAGPGIGGGRSDWEAIVIGVATTLLLAIVLMWWDQPAPAARPAVERPVSAAAPLAIEARWITSSPGFELSPSLNPDGSMVAYIAVPDGQRNVAIMVQTTTPTAPRQLTRPTGGADDIAPAWSPDGRTIAFLRVVPERGCQVVLVPASGGSERVVADCDERHVPSFDWTPDGRGLVFGGHGVAHDQPGLFVLDLDTGEERALEYDASPYHHDFSPRYSPDGRWIVFVRNTPVGDFWRIPATGGPAERLTRLNAQILGWDWSPSGRALLYSGHDESGSQLYRLDLDTGLRTGLGIVDAEEPDVAAHAPAIAFVHRATRFGLYRFDLDAPGAPGERLFASSGRDRLAALAPDGRQLAFASDRSGRYRLWWSDLERPGTGPVLMEGVEPGARHLPSWSADGRRLLLVGRGTTAGDARPGVFEISPASGRVSRLPLPVDDPVQALYAPGAGSGERVLLVAADRQGRMALHSFTRVDGRWIAGPALPLVSHVQADPPRDRILFTRPGEPGLWQVGLDLDPASVVRLDEAFPSVGQYRSWTVAPDGGVLGIERRVQCAAQLEYRGPAEADDWSRCLDLGRRAATYGFSLDARNNRIYVTLVEHDVGDIGFASYEVPPETLWPGVTK
ncbi:hypothetical protein N799_09330 [Lysobacter arseniciresistens ZS79]|uniref:OmpR/PhoB-type domain-containing protein n=1 Tax=Lysobacter arseniciresistens ZS79 TaxID=913325 RepID=A0A0A0EW60_9GAMM|nr:winged helix-turn-helix domain-containing protein [Lysobacter arseniciresistens]KGM54465.1 hypothetical protein N799_09330 [Lysobacter arseniciresistens ZS79]